MKKYVLADGTKDKRRLGFGDYLIYELAVTVLHAFINGSEKAIISWKNL